MTKRIGVQVGQRYVKAQSTWNTPPVWEVNAIYSGAGSISHAGLLNLAHPLERKTVSFSALLDKTHYRLVMAGNRGRESAQGGEQSGASQAGASQAGD